MKHGYLLLCLLLQSMFGLYAQTPGNALNFDGTDDRVVCPLPSVFNNIGANDFTIEAWVNPTGSAFARILYAQNSTTNFVSLGTGVGNVIYFYVIDNGTTYSVATNNSIPQGQWTHIAATWNASVKVPQVYFNGVLQTTAAGGSSSTGTGTAMELGSRPGGAQYFNGSIDEVRIWSQQRTACQIGLLKNNSLFGNETGLVAYYNFNTGNAGNTNTGLTTLTDLAASNTGTLTNFGLTGATSNWVASGAVITGSGSPTLSFTYSNATCGLSNGNINFTNVPGVAPFQYSIDGGTTYGASPNFAGLGAGVYNLSVIDANNCQTLDQITITNTTPPTISNVATTNATCGTTSGSISITASGTSTLEYSINGGSSFQANPSFGLIPAGTYDIVVRDAVGCQATSQVTLTNIPGPTIQTIALTPTFCGGNAGSIVITATGGTGTITYSIDNGASSQTGNSFTGLAAGTYAVVVNDDNGCAVGAPATVADSLITLNGTASTTDATCGDNNGSITVSPTNGTAPFEYSFNNGNTFSPSNELNGVGGSTTNVIIIDANGCQGTVLATVNNQAGPIITNITTTDEACGQGNGSITITATGGTAPLAYSVDGIQQNSPVFQGLTTNGYNVTVIDANGCQTNQQTMVGSVGGPSIDNIATTDAVCGLDNGTITITAVGTGLEYSLDGGSYQNSNLFTNLQDNNYSISVRDANGCEAFGMATIGSTNAADVTVTNPGGTNELLATATGATFQWLNCDDNFAEINGATNALFAATTYGNYAVEVTQNGCVDTSACYEAIVIGIDEPSFAATVGLYPNPTNGGVTLQLKNIEAAVSVKLVNSLGQILLNQTYTQTNSVNFLVDAPAGIYLVVVENAIGQTATIRLIKE